MHYSLFKVERCLREGETCNIASAGYDSTVCRCVEVFKGCEFCKLIPERNSQGINLQTKPQLPAYLKMKLEM